MSKGIVMELSDKTVIIMTQDGRFERYPRRGLNCSVGQEIVIGENHAGGSGAIHKWMRYRYVSAAAIFCLIVMASLGLYLGKSEADQVVAYVTLDINPSVEVGLNAAEEVVEARGINDDGASLIQGIIFKGLTIDAFSEAIVDRLEINHYLESNEVNILIASTIVVSSSGIDDAALSQKVEQKVVESIDKKQGQANKEVVVTAISAPKEVRTEAVSKGVSTGKMAALILSQTDVKPIELDELKTKPIKQLFKEHEEVKEQLKVAGKSAKEQMKSQLNKLKEIEKQQEKEQKQREKEQKKQEKQPVSNIGNKLINGNNNGNKKYDNKKNDDKKYDDKKNDDKKYDDKKNDDKKNDDRKNDDRKNDDKKNDDRKNNDRKNNDRKNDDHKNIGNRNNDDKVGTSTAVWNSFPAQKVIKRNDRQQNNQRQNDQKKSEQQKSDEQLKKKGQLQNRNETEKNNEQKKTEQKKTEQKKNEQKKNEQKKNEQKKNEQKKNEQKKNEQMKNKEQKQSKQKNEIRL